MFRMKSTIKFLSVLAVLLFVTSLTYAQHGYLRVKFLNPLGGTPVSIAFNQTFDKRTIYINNPGYPPVVSTTTTGIFRTGTATAGSTTTLESPGGTMSGYTAYTSYIVTNFNIRVGGQSYYTLTPTEIANLEYTDDSIEITANGGYKFTITNTA